MTVNFLDIVKIDYKDYYQFELFVNQSELDEITNWLVINVPSYKMSKPIEPTNSLDPYIWLWLFFKDDADASYFKLTWLTEK